MKKSFSYSELQAKHSYAYLDQIERSIRILNKIKSMTNLNTTKDEFIEIRDLELSFLLHCNHIYDWIKNSESYDKSTAQDINKYRESSIYLSILSHLCNKTKHYKLFSEMSSNRTTKGEKKYTCMQWHSPNSIESLILYNVNVATVNNSLNGDKSTYQDPEKSHCTEVSHHTNQQLAVDSHTENKVLGGSHKDRLCSFSFLHFADECICAWKKYADEAFNIKDKNL